MAGSHTDNAERKRAELSLQDSERRLTRQNAALRALTGIRIGGLEALQGVFQEITTAAAETLEVRRASIWLYDPERQSIHCQDLYERDHRRHGAGGVLMEREHRAYFAALATERSLAVADACSDPRTRELRAGYLDRHGVTSRLDAPIRRGGEVIGVVCHEHVGPMRAWTLDEQSFATSIADLSALAIEIGEHRHAEEAWQRAHDELEARVRASTHELVEANERLQGLDRLKSMFIASISHELRTPLNAILGFVGIVLQGLSGELNAKQEDHLGRAYGAAKHLLDLVEDVIDTSKIEAGYADVHIEDFSLRVLLEEAQTGLGRQGREKGLALEVRPFEDVALRTDRKRVLQCVVNLLSNAVKYTERGTVGVEVQASDAEVEIEVRDTGVGIAPDAMVRLFKPFERIDSPLRIRNPGTGLGLYLTRKIATELLHGTVTAESVPGQGSTFGLRLPRVLAPD